MSDIGQMAKGHMQTILLIIIAITLIIIAIITGVCSCHRRKHEYFDTTEPKVVSKKKKKSCMAEEEEKRGSCGANKSNGSCGAKKTNGSCGAKKEAVKEAMKDNKWLVDPLSTQWAAAKSSWDNKLIAARNDADDNRWGAMTNDWKEKQHYGPFASRNDYLLAT